MTQQIPPAMPSTNDLPSFERPPVVETILGVQFVQLPKFRAAHLGAYWKSLGQGWNHVIDAPRLPPMVEKFGGMFELPQIHLKLTQTPPIRLQIRTDDQSRMIQVQNGRFHYNWLRADEQQKYPRYGSIRAEFERAFRAFVDFIKAENLGEVVPNYWEVTYINHVPKGHLWSDVRDWSSLFNGMTGLQMSSGNLVLESMEFDWHFVIPPQLGRLHVQAQHGQVTDGEPGDKSLYPPSTEIMILTLTSRGPIGSRPGGGVKDFIAGLDLGRETIVRAFHDLTSPKAHEVWGIQQ